MTRSPSHRRYSDIERERFAERAIEDGFCVLPEHFPRPTMDKWREAFEPLFRTQLASERKGERGAARYYVTLPFEEPFADPEIFEDDDVLAIVNRLVGVEPVMCQLASDTPLLGSDYQDVHRDTPPLFPELRDETPAFQLAVNFALVDVTLENGPIEIARGTHRMTKDEALAKIASGERPLTPIPMRAGDVMIRDVRGLHRGTPNRTNTPRPMVVIGYSRRWLFRPEVSIRVPRTALDALSPRARSLLRFNPIVEPGASIPDEEVYQAFAY